MKKIFTKKYQYKNTKYCHAELVSASPELEIPNQVRNDRRRIMAFTLAEVLITLTIIGVIAALTIPNLMQNYRKHQIEVGLKEAYTTLSNALTMAQTEYGSLQEMVDACKDASNFPKQANCFKNNYIKPYVKYSKICNVADRSCNNIFPTDRIRQVDGTTSSTAAFQPNSQMSTIALNNGILIGVIWWSGDPLFLVDVNGWKGYNQICSDTFYFHIEQKEPYKLVGGYNYANETCSVSIMKNGWKIPDDYPVKKF